MTINVFKNIGVTAVTVNLLGLGGCAQLQSYGNSIWSGTKSFSSNSARKMSSLLRPVPKQIERFETRQRRGISDADVAVFMRRYAVPNVETMPTLSAMNHTRESGVSIYRPSRQKTPSYIQIASPSAPVPAATTPPLRPASNPGHFARVNEQLAGAAPAKTAPITASYVKTGGGADMADWQACQASAGDIYIPSANSYAINPAFDRCMRGRGYLPESEAVALLE